MSFDNNTNSFDKGRVRIPVENAMQGGFDRRFMPPAEIYNEENIFEPPISTGRDFHKLTVSKTGPKNGILMCAAESIPPLRRIESAKEKWHNGELGSAAGAVALMAVNLPEDWKDLKTAGEQIRAFCKGEKYVGAYDYKNFQHEFSFFRGTLLEPLVDLKNTKHPELAEKLLSWDESLLQTSFGEKILSWLKTNANGYEEVKAINKTTGACEITKDLRGDPRYALSFEGGVFGKLTARAMARTTKIGVGVVALFELPKMLKSMASGDTMSEKVGNVAKQTVKSGINIASTTAGMAYCGAIGSKYGKGLGSLIGMGIGAVAGNKLSQKLQNVAN